MSERFHLEIVLSLHKKYILVTICHKPVVKDQKRSHGTACSCNDFLAESIRQIKDHGELD